MKSFLLFSCLCLSLSAFETQPWLGNTHEFNSFSSWEYSRFNKAYEGSDTISHRSSLHTWTSSIDFSPDPEKAFELGTKIFKRAGSSAFFSHLTLSGRYIWKNDLVGDSHALCSTVALRILGKESPEIIQQGSQELSLHIARGQESSREADWTGSCYSRLSYIQAKRGKGAIEALCSWTKKRGQDILSLKCRARYGLGKEDLDLASFHSYSRIAYRLCEIDVNYTRDLYPWGQLSLFHSRKLYVRNALKGQSIGLRYQLPFFPAFLLK